jgi:hypothetical protein
MVNPSVSTGMNLLPEYWSASGALVARPPGRKRAVLVLIPNDDRLH